MLLLTRDGHPVDNIFLKNREVQLNSMDWAPDGEGFYAGAVVGHNRSELLYIDRQGHSHFVWSANVPQMWAIPSPDGKHIAIMGGAVESNAYLLEF